MSLERVSHTPPQMHPGKQTAVLHDPFPLFLEAVEQLLRRIEVDVLAKTTSPKRVITILGEQQPTLLVSELQGAGGTPDGIELVREARCKVPSLKIVILSSQSDPQWIEAAFDAGASAFVLKTVQPDDLAAAVRQAFSHSVYFPGSIRSAGQAKRRDSSELQGLTRRELEILRLVSEGHSNSELAKMLWVTEQTVKFHLSNIYRKLNVSNRTEASRWAQLHGVLSQTPPEPEREARIATFEKRAWLSRAS
jgi:DNA-binding NarL/FixJ family response regulator